MGFAELDLYDSSSVVPGLIVMSFIVWPRRLQVRLQLPDVMGGTLFPPNCQRLSDGVIGPVLQRARLPPFHSFVNVDNIPSASEWTTKENEEIEYRRKKNRLHQARFKKRQQQKVENLEKDIQQLQNELQQLHVRQSILTVGIGTKTIWQIAAEYFRIFRNGYRTHTQRDFCLATMTTDVEADDKGNGVETILQHWEAFSLMFEDIDIQLVRLEHCADGGVLASVRSVATLSDKTISCAFPHLVKEGQVSLVASKLQDQRIEMRGWVRFQWSDEMERVDSVRYNVDILSPIMQLLRNLEDTARVFNNANITPESKLLAA